MGVGQSHRETGSPVVALEGSGAAFFERALYLNQDSSNRSHEPISSIRQDFQVLRCFGLKGSGKGFVEVLSLFSDTIL